MEEREQGFRFTSARVFRYNVVLNVIKKEETKKTESSICGTGRTPPPTPLPSKRAFFYKSNKKFQKIITGHRELFCQRILCGTLAMKKRKLQLHVDDVKH